MTPKGKYSRERALEVRYKFNDSENIGTGFFIKAKSNNYLVTAKHTFSKRDNKENENWKNVNIEDLKGEFSSITVKYESKKICDINSILFEYEDLIVFETSNIKITVQDIKIIYKEEYSSEIEFFFHGLCKKKFQEKLFSPTPDNDYLYNIQDNQANKVGAIKGCSGAGVYIEEDGEFYLVGILLQRYDDGVFFTIFNFPKYLKENPQDCFDICNIENEVYIKEYELYISKNLTTVGEYNTFCIENKKEKPKQPYFYEDEDKFPVVNVSWNNAMEYCKWLTDKNKKFDFRLPTIEEWEYIANKNMPDKNYKEYIWCQEETTQVNIIKTKKAGKLGIYDMYGNVHEWCYDTDRENERKKIAKGGSYKFSLEYLLNIKESISFPKDRENITELSFRIIKEKKKEPRPKLKHKIPIEEQISSKKIEIYLLKKISSDLEDYNKLIPNATKKFKIVKSCLESYLKASESAKK